MSAAGSKRVKVVQRKLIGLRGGAPGLVGEHHQRPAGERGVGGEAGGRAGVVRVGGAAHHEAAGAEDADVASAPAGSPAP